MALLHLASALVLAASAVQAEEPAAEPSARRDVEIRFVPAASGTVSLGIYDAAGRLVRVLCDEWTFNRFRIGLNGLSTSWDGRDGTGQPVPAGSYAARGFVVGDVQIAGEAVHFNDWIEGPDSPRITSVAGEQLLPDGDILLSARLAGRKGALVRYSPESEARWRTVVTEPRPVPAREAQLAVSSTLAFVLLDGRLRAVGLSDGVEIGWPVPAENITAVAAREDRLALLDENGLRFSRLPSFAPQGEATDLPPALVSVALLEQGAVAAARDGSVWRWQAGWSKLEVPEEVKLRRVTGGRGETFWALEERDDGSIFVGQYSPEEGRLAEWSPGPDGGKILSLAGDPTRDYFVATLGWAEGQRTVGIRRREAADGWEFVFDKKITRSADFGWHEGRLSPREGERPDGMTVRLVENPLDPEAPRDLPVRAVANETGTGLATRDGLPLVRVSGEAGYTGVMLLPSANGRGAKFFQGDGACVEEYRIAELGRITSFDAGTIEMTGGGEEAPSPPVIEPEMASDGLTGTEPEE